MAKYHKMTYELFYNKYKDKYSDIKEAELNARKDAYNELKQSLQGFEMRLNNIGNSRGSYPFVSVSFGDIDNEWEFEVAKALLQVRMEGHGDKGKKKKLLFPKLIFFFNKDKYETSDMYKELFDYATSYVVLKLCTQTS